MSESELKNMIVSFYYVYELTIDEKNQIGSYVSKINHKDANLQFERHALTFMFRDYELFEYIKYIAKIMDKSIHYLYSGTDIMQIGSETYHLAVFT